MTRYARRGNKKSPLVATPWTALKKNGYMRFENEEEVFDNEQASPTEMQGRLRTVKKGQLKETRKAKLTKKPTAKLLLKQKMTARKLKEKFVDSELLPLLSSTDTKEHASGTAREGDKKSVAVTPAKRKKKGDPRSSSDNGGKKKSRKNESRKSEGDLKSSSDNGNKKSRKIERAPKPKREKKHNSVMSGEAGGETCSGDEDCADSSYNSTTPLLSARRASEKREKRIEARRLRRQKRKVCFNCRESGHMVQDCPRPQSSGGGVAGLCFKCGSGEHTSRSCKVDTSGEFPYAKCFICGETGHLSRSCPDNPKGLYPNGGCCKLCGSVEHLKSNCPEKSSQKSQESDFGGQGLVQSNPFASADAEDFEVTSSRASMGGGASITASGRRKQRRKVVNF